MKRFFLLFSVFLGFHSVMMAGPDKAAIVIVDLQKGFMEGGSLAIAGANKAFGDSVVSNAKSMVNALGSDNVSVVLTQDHHPLRHVSFRSTFFEMEADGSVRELDGKPVLRQEIVVGDVKLSAEQVAKLEPTIIYLDESKKQDKSTHLYSIKSPFTNKVQRLWPEHCVQGTDGNTFFDGLQSLSVEKTIITKGMDAKFDSYSGVADEGGARTGLVDYLKSKNVKEAYVSGLAFDYCVKATALDLRKNGFSVVLMKPLTKSVDPKEDTKNIKELVDAGVVVLDHDDFDKVFNNAGSVNLQKLQAFVNRHSTNSVFTVRNCFIGTGLLSVMMMLGYACFSRRSKNCVDGKCSSDSVVNQV